MEKLIILLFVLIFWGCGNAPDMRVNLDVEYLREEAFIQTDTISLDSTKDIRYLGQPIKYIFVHTFANTRDWTLDEIHSLWKSYGWSRGGYSFIVNSNGSIYIEQPQNDSILTYDEITNGVHGYNRNSVHICWQGGGYYGEDSRTDVQKKAMYNLLIMLKGLMPNAKIMSHHSVNPHKTCPNFNAEAEYKNIK